MGHGQSKPSNQIVPQPTVDTRLAFDGVLQDELDVQIVPEREPAQDGLVEDVLEHASSWLTNDEMINMHVAGLLGPSRTNPPLDEVLSLGELGAWAERPGTAERAAKVTRLIIRVDAQSPRDDLSNLPAMPFLRGIKLNITGFPHQFDPRTLVPTPNDWLQQFVTHLPWHKVRTLVVCTFYASDAFNTPLVIQFNKELAQILGRCTDLQNVALRASKGNVALWLPDVFSALSGKHAVVEVYGGYLPKWNTPDAPGPRVRQLDLEFKPDGNIDRQTYLDVDFWPPILRSAQLEHLRLFIKDKKCGAWCDPALLQDPAVIAAQRRRCVLVSFTSENHTQMGWLKLAPMFAYALDAKIRYTVINTYATVWMLIMNVAKMKLEAVPPTRMELECVIQHQSFDIDRPRHQAHDIDELTPAELLQRYNFLTLRFVFQGFPAGYARMTEHADYQECFRLFPGRLIIQNAAPLGDNKRDEQQEWEQDLGTDLNEYRLCRPEPNPWVAKEPWVAARLKGSRQHGWQLEKERPVCSTFRMPWHPWTTKLCDVVQASPTKLPVPLSDSRKLVHLSTLPGRPCMYIATIRRSRGAGSRTGYYLVYNPRDRTAAATKVSQMRGVGSGLVVPPRRNRGGTNRVTPARGNLGSAVYTID
jgi:hypothetical protein